MRRRVARLMDSAEFCRLHEVSQANMVAKGEVRTGIMSVPDHDAPMRECFWCGDPFDILLFGKLSKKKRESLRMGMDDDEGSARRVVTDHEPCATCKEIMGRGICLMEADRVDGQAIATGRYWIFTDETIRTMVNLPGMVDSILKKRRALIDKATARQIGLYDSVD